MAIRHMGILALASAAVAAGHNHQHNHLHARGTGSGAAPATPTGLPACWSTCFQQAGVSSPEALANNAAVTECIKSTCSAEDAAKYEAWLEKEQGAPYPIGHNSTAIGPTATGDYSTSICTETSTLIYQTTTEYLTYLVTHTLSASAGPSGPAGGPGGYGEASSDVSVSPATESAGGPGGYSPGAPSGVPGGGEGSPIGGGDEECSEVTVTTTERTTVTVTAGNGGGAPSSPAPEAPSSYAQPSSPAAAPSPETEGSGSGSAPGSYVSEAAVPTSWATPSSYENPVPESAAPSYGSPASSGSAPDSSPSSPSGGSSNGWKGKRGLAYNYTSDVVDALFEGAHIGWATNWDSEDYSRLPAGFPFIPTLHSADAYWTEKFAKDVELALSNGAEYIFGQNEPDMASQANQSPKAAADTWRQYVEPFAGRAKLCAPSITNAPVGSGLGTDWLDQFFTECSDCTIDCVNQHWYDARGNDFEIFKEQIGAAAKYGKPVFVGEFAGVGSADEISDFLGQVMPWMDSNADIIGYAYFMVANGLLVDGGAVSAYGQTYCNA